MNLPFGLTITRTKATDLITRMPAALQPVGPWHGLLGMFQRMGRVQEPFSGAWQRNREQWTADVLAHSTVWSCLTLIMGDVGKIAVNLIGEDADGIWQITESPAFSPVLRKPNHYQNRIKFFEYWIASLLTRGNTYALKRYDNRDVVTRLYILDPARVRVLVAPNQDVYYELQQDNLSGLPEAVTVPASEIIHDIYKAPFHPLCGLPPILAAILPALQGLRIQENYEQLFANNSQPGGIITAPHQISSDTADRIQQHWNSNFAGPDNVGKVAVLGDGLEYKPMSLTAVETQLIDQLKWGDERICSAFGVPPFMVGIGPWPTGGDLEKAISFYYTRTLQTLFESLESALDEGLSLPAKLGVEFDIEALHRMDAEKKMKIATDGVKGGIFSPNEARKKYFNLPAVPGGDAPFMQQQNWSLEDLAKRREMGVLPKPPTAPTPPTQPDEPPTESDVDDAKGLISSAYRVYLLERAA